jgi:GNAT superfamily N-acetyltransferase
MDEIIIRFATADDVSQLARFRLGLRSRPGTNIETEDEFLRRCEAWMSDTLNRSEWHCWVAVTKGSDSDRLASTGQHLLGAIWLQRISKIPNPTSESERLAYITNFFVTESARTKGLGSRMMDEVLDWCREERVHSVILWPTERSRPLYLRYGFDVPKGLFELTLGAK